LCSVEIVEAHARTLAVLLDTLAEARAPHALFGGLAAGFHGKTRLTGDVDMIVPRRFVALIQAGLERRGYETRQFTYMMKAFVRGESASVADLVMLEANPVLRSAFAATLPAQILGLPVTVVRSGVFVALKFEAAITPKRPFKDRARDVADIRGVLERTFGPEDEQLALEIARRMRPGAVADLAGLLDDVRRGRWPRVVRHADVQSGLLRRQGAARLLRRS
jgi:hypothetical protein